MSRGLKSAKNRFKLSAGLNSLNSASIRFSIYFQRKNLLNIIWNLFNIQCYFINTSLYPHCKFEFEQDQFPVCTGLPDNSMYWPDPMVQYVALTRLTYDRGQFSWHSPVRGLTMTTPMARSDFLHYPAKS